MSKLFKFTLILLLFSFPVKAIPRDRDFSFGETASLGSGEKTIEAKVDKRVVETGEIFSYELKIQGEIGDASLKLPEFEGFSVLSQSQSQSYSSKGGVSKTSISLIYLLFAPEPGTFTINPATLVENEKKKHQSRAITIRVKGESLERKQKILPYIEEGIEL